MLLSVDKDSFVRGRNATLQISEMMINAKRERQRERGRERERERDREGERQRDFGGEGREIT